MYSGILDTATSMRVINFPSKEDIKDFITVVDGLIEVGTVSKNESCYVYCLGYQHKIEWSKTHLELTRLEQTMHTGIASVQKIRGM